MSNSTFNVSQVFGFLPNFLDHCTTTTFNCSSPIPPCGSPKRMDFGSLWTITENYWNLCQPTGQWAWLSQSTVNLSSAALAAVAAYQIVGNGMTPFPKPDIWSRLTTWKAPLIQLIATFPRPPLDKLTEMLTVLHLVSDPVGSMQHLLYKLEVCQRRAIYWQEKIGRDDPLTVDTRERVKRSRGWRNLAIITESYSELGEDPTDALLSKFNSQQRKNFLTECSVTGGALAADRATTLVPVIVAELIFMAVFFIGMFRLQSSEQRRLSGTTHVNIELHSIGFSALFFWLIPLVGTAAVIGTSQTEKAIPRILMRFRRDVRRANVLVELPKLHEATNCNSKYRWLHGMYSWQPLQQRQISNVREFCRLERRFLKDHASYWQCVRRVFLLAWPTIYRILPSLVVICATATGILISVFVPPHVWRCRTWGESYFAFGWLGSFVLSELIAFCSPQKTWFVLMFCKDLTVFLGAIAWIILTQIGWYNRPRCYIGAGETGMVLPEQPDAYDQLQRGLRFGGVYVTIFVLGFLFQAVLVPVLIYARYESAISTLTQRDQSASELSDLDYGPGERNKSSVQDAIPPDEDSPSTTAHSANSRDGPPYLQLNFDPRGTDNAVGSMGTELHHLLPGGSNFERTD